MKFKYLLCLGMLVSLSIQAQAVSPYMENPKAVGEARLEVMFWDIYDAKLIAENGQYNPDKPFALSLTYLRDFKGKNIASRSIDEMRKQGMKDEMKLAKWYEKMEQVFPDVRKGQNLTGVVDDQGYSHFYFNEQKVGSIEDVEFSKWFFNIWLSERTSEPEVREKLLGSVN